MFIIERFVLPNVTVCLADQSLCMARNCDFYAHTVLINWPAMTWLLAKFKQDSASLSSDCSNQACSKKDDRVLNDD